MKKNLWVMFLFIPFIFLSCISLEGASKDPSYYFELGKESEAVKDLYGAIDYYTKAIALDNNYFRAYIQRGVIYYEKEQYQFAINDFSYVLSKTDDSKCFFNRGNVYYEQSLYSKAIDDYLAVVRINPLDADAYVMLGNCYAILENYTLAKQYYKKALSINPNDEQAKQNLSFLE